MKKITLLIAFALTLSACEDDYYMEGRVTTESATEITQQTAVLNGNVEIVTVGSEAKPDIARGFVLGTNPSDLNIRLTDNKIAGEGNFSFTTTNLLPNTKYYARAYARISYYGGYEEFADDLIRMSKTFYGNTIEFSTTDGISAQVLCVTLDAAGIMVQKTDITGDTPVGWSTGNSLCENSILAGYTDWRLPTKDELTVLYNERGTIGGFTTSGSYLNYWSSTSISSGYWIQNFSSGAQYNSLATSIHRARCVRTLP
jgi:hypothetical protein